MDNRNEPMSLLALLVQKFAIVAYVPVHGSLSLESSGMCAGRVQRQCAEPGSWIPARRHPAVSQPPTKPY